MGEFSCRLATGDVDLRAALEVRRLVSVHEQGISEDPVFNGCDSEALHMMVKDGERVIGSARVRFVSANQAKLERMAILKRYRRKGIGRKMVLFLDAVWKDKNVQQVVIHAQLEVISFHKSCGFHPVGPSFQEAGIDHIKMWKQLRRCLPSNPGDRTSHLMNQATTRTSRLPSLVLLYRVPLLCPFR